MLKKEPKIKDLSKNPFLTERAEILWKRLDKNGKPLSKEEIRRREKEIKKKNS